VLDALEAARARLGLSQLEAFPVHHVARSTGLKLSGGGGGGDAADGGGGGGGRPPWSVVFSGDTRPCASVVAAARGATLLVHEATFEDELAGDALAKRHSTLSEALGVARDSGVYRTVLTHFSSRYPKIPVLAGTGAAADADADAGEGAAGTAAPAGGTALLSMVGRSVAVGFDFMTVNLADLPWLPLVVPAADELLREEGFVDGADEGEGGEGAAAAVPGAGGVRQEGR
jgi:ribonuclease Z